MERERELGVYVAGNLCMQMCVCVCVFVSKCPFDAVN